MKLKSILLTICWLIIIISSYSQNESNYKLTTLPGPFTVTQVTDDFWIPKIERNLAVTSIDGGW